GGARDSAGQELQRAPTEYALHGPVDDIGVGAVVAGAREQRESGSGQQAAARERDILIVDLVGQTSVLAGEKLTQPEQLQLLGGFLAGAEHAKVIDLTANGRLAEVQRVTEKREVAFAEEGRDHGNDEDG